MAYEKQTWTTGDTITANKLNYMEDGIASAGGGDVGYECSTEESTITYFEGNLTTVSSGAPFAMASFTPSQPIEGDSLTVTFNGTEYELPKTEHGYGEETTSPVFTTYPCFIDGGNNFFTQSAGTYSVKMQTNTTTETIETSECFQKAVKSVGMIKYVKDDPSDNGGVIENFIGDNIPLASHNQATGDFSHAEGGGLDAEYGVIKYYPTIASGMGSHAEGGETTASGNFSHAEGGITTASGNYSHAEGVGTIASERGSHAEGSYTVASGRYSHAEGMNTEALGQGQHVLGKFNIIAPDYAEIVGNGTSDNNRSNARTLDWDGNESLQGSLTLGKGTVNETTITATQLKALLALLS